MFSLLVVAVVNKSILAIRKRDHGVRRYSSATSGNPRLGDARAMAPFKLEMGNVTNDKTELRLIVDRQA